MECFQFPGSPSITLHRASAARAPTVRWAPCVVRGVLRLRGPAGHVAYRAGRHGPRCRAREDDREGRSKEGAKRAHWELLKVGMWNLNATGTLYCLGNELGIMRTCRIGTYCHRMRSVWVLFFRYMYCMPKSEGMAPSSSSWGSADTHRHAPHTSNHIRRRQGQPPHGTHPERRPYSTFDT